MCESGSDDDEEELGGRVSGAVVVPGESLHAEGYEGGDQEDVGYREGGAGEAGEDVVEAKEAVERTSETRLDAREAELGGRF